MLAPDEDNSLALWSEIRGRDLSKPKSDKGWDEVYRSIKWQHAARGCNWYAVHCAGAHDTVVEECLTRIGVEVFVPKCLELRTVPKRELTGKQRNNPLPIRRPTAVAMFPRYPFIRCDLTDSRRHEAFSLLNVQGIICDGDSPGFVPALIDDAIIDAIRALQSGETIPRGTTVRHLAYAIGDKVRIANGPFFGSRGEIDQFPDLPIDELDETMKIRLLVSLFGRKTPVEMTIADIEKL